MHNIDPTHIAEVEDSLFRIKLTPEGHAHFYKLAWARVHAKLDAGTFNRRFDRGMSEADAISKAITDYYVSLEGEAAFAVLFNVPMAMDVTTFGDPGYDFQSGSFFLDIKTTIHERGVLNFHSQEYINTISVKKFAPSLAMVLATRPMDTTRPRSWNQGQWITLIGWLSFLEAVKQAVNGEKGGSPMIYVEQSKLWKMAELNALTGREEGK